MFGVNASLLQNIKCKTEKFFISVEWYISTGLIHPYCCILFDFSTHHPNMKSRDPKGLNHTVFETLLYHAMVVLGLRASWNVMKLEIAILQTIFSSMFGGMWCVWIWIEKWQDNLRYITIGSGNGLAPNRRANTRTNVDQVWWCHMASVLSRLQWNNENK